MANGFISPLKNGTGSEPNRPGAADTTVPRGACTLFPHARPNNFLTYVNGHPADLGARGRRRRGPQQLRRDVGGRPPRPHRPPPG